MVSISSCEITLGFQKGDLLGSGEFTRLWRILSVSGFTIAKKRGSGFLLMAIKSRFSRLSENTGNSKGR
jgi:hypothetical protein